jgi:methanogenic corrinoid protein MtbC1
LNHISVAQEHYGTATTETLMSEMLRDREEIDHGPNFFLGACVAGSLHSLGVRMLSDLLESAGWKIYFTGANTPSSSLLDLVNRFRVDVLGISATTPSDIAEVRRLIDAVRKSKKAKTRIMVGGRIFCEFPNLWKTVGADASSIDAISGVKVAQKLAAS